MNRWNELIARVMSLTGESKANLLLQSQLRQDREMLDAKRMEAESRHESVSMEIWMLLHDLSLPAAAD